MLAAASELLIGSLSNDALDTPEAQGDDDWRHWACTYNRATKRRVIYLFDCALAAQVTQLEKALEQVGQHEQNLGQVGQSLSVVHGSSAGREVHGGLVRLAPVEGTPSLVDAATGKALWPALLVNSAPGWTSLATLKVAVHTDSGWVFSVKPESH